MTTSAPPEAADRITQLEAEVARLRAVVRVNLLRYAPHLTHAEIDAALAPPEPEQPPYGHAYISMDELRKDVMLRISATLRYLGHGGDG